MPAPEPADTGWQGRREVGSQASVRLAAALTRWLPRRVARWLIAPTALYFLATQPAARAASRAVLARTLPHRPRWRDVYRHLFRFGVVVMDRAYFLQGRLDGLSFTVDGEDAVLALARSGRGGFLVGAHLGSFEAARALARTRAEPMRFAMVMYEDNAQRIQATLAALNPALAADVIGLGRPDSMLRVMRALDDGALVGLLADRLPATGPDRGEARTRPFLGSPARFPVGPFRLAALMRRPVVLMLGLYLGGDRYHLVFEPIADFSDGGADRATLGRTDGDRAGAIEAALDRYVTRLEHHCRAQPFNWFNFFDFWASGEADAGDGQRPVGPPRGRTATLAALASAAATAAAIATAALLPAGDAGAQAVMPDVSRPRGAGSAAMPAAVPTFESILARIGGSASREARFTEALHTALLDAPVRSSGTLRFEAPDRLEKRTEQPRAESLALDGDQLVLERDGRRRSMPAAQLPGVAALVGALRDVLAGRPAPIRRLFRVEVQGSEAAWTIDLLPSDRDAAQWVSRITLSGGAAIERIETRLADGDRSDLRIEGR